MMTAEKTHHWRGELRINEPMSEHTSWRAGGNARRFYKPADLDDLCDFLLEMVPQESLLWLGLGSNLLVRDGGFPGTVIFTHGALNDLEWLDDVTLRVGAGVTCAKVARVTAKQGLTGAEFLAGIPGTIGGALAMNAGAFGGETWDMVSAVETIDQTGRLHKRSTKCRSAPPTACLVTRQAGNTGQRSWRLIPRTRASRYGPTGRTT